jgi:hypothetical protein
MEGEWLPIGQERPRPSQNKDFSLMENSCHDSCKILLQRMTGCGASAEKLAETDKIPTPACCSEPFLSDK